MSKLTPWFPGTVKPARPGVYERTGSVKALKGLAPWYALWDGAYWHWSHETLAGAAQTQSRSTAQLADAEIAWRGLAAEPKP